MIVRVLGTAGIDAPAGQSPPRLERKAREVLSILTVRAPAAVTLDELADLLWDDPPPSTVKTLRAHLSRIRAALAAAPGGADVERVGRAGYRLRPFHLSLSESGVTVRSDSLTATTPWTAIAAITVERQPGSPATMSPVIVLWPADGTELLAKAKYKRNDRRGYELLALDELIETADQAIAILRHYAGDKFVLVDTPTQRVRRS